MNGERVSGERIHAHHTDQAPAAIGPYAQAVTAGGFLFTSGQIPLDPATGEMVAGGFDAQARQVLANLRAVLAAAGCGFSDVVKATVYVTDLADFPKLNALYGEAMGQHRPARSTVQVAALPKGALVEIDLKIAEAKLEGLKGEYAATVELARLTEQAAKAGGASQTEVANIQAKLARAKAEVQVGEYQVELIRRKLAGTGAPGTSETRPAGPQPKPAAVSPEVRKLRESKLKAARSVLDKLIQEPRPNQGPPGLYSEDVYRWSCRVMDAWTELNPAVRAEAAREHLDRMKNLEAIRQEQVKAGLFAQADAVICRSGASTVAELSAAGKA